MVANMEVDKVADIVAKKDTQLDERGMQKRRRKGTQFGERVGHGGWLIGPTLFRPKSYPTCVSSKLCEFIDI